MSRVSPRTYLPLDCRVFEDDKIIKAGERAAFLYLNILCAIKLDGADGTITERKIGRLHVDKWRQRVDNLVAAGLLLALNEATDDDPDAEITYLVPAWSRWNMLSHDIEKKREQARTAAETRWNRHASADATRMRPAYAKKDKINKDTESDPQSIASSVDNFAERLGKSRY
jgi:hypothetical protein